MLESGVPHIKQPGRSGLVILSSSNDTVKLAEMPKDRVLPWFLHREIFISITFWTSPDSRIHGLAHGAAELVIPLLWLETHHLGAD
jgi:hypothetical protein